MNFLVRFSVKAAVYFIVLLVFMVIGLLPAATVLSVFVTALVLALVNMIIRPIFVAVALPFNMITFGLASVFANLLTLVIASGICGGAVAAGFWVMLLTAFVIMLADDGVRLVRQALKPKQTGEV